MIMQYMLNIFLEREGMELDYSAIGKRIRARRTRLGLSQEQLAERADLSVQHVSHIETANTKLSLPVLVQIANTLGVTPNDLLCDSAAFAAGSYRNEIDEIVAECDIHALRVVSEIVKAAVPALQRFDAAQRAEQPRST